jgi:hypothetical protein
MLHVLLPLVLMGGQVVAEQTTGLSTRQTSAAHHGLCML